MEGPVVVASDEFRAVVSKTLPNESHQLMDEFFVLDEEFKYDVLFTMSFKSLQVFIKAENQEWKDFIQALFRLFVESGIAVGFNQVFFFFFFFFFFFVPASPLHDALSV